METGLIVAIVAVIGSYIAQKILIRNLAQTKGVNLSTGRLVPVLAFLGVAFVAFAVMNSNEYGGVANAVSSDGTMGIVIFLVSVAAFAYLLIRNIRGAGVGLGILLTVLQTVSGLLILFLGVAAVGVSMTGTQLGAATSLGKQRQTSEARAVEAMAARAKRTAEEHEQDAAVAEHYGFTSTRDAAEAGVIPGTEENLNGK